jgi:hypothetical protein
MDDKGAVIHQIQSAFAKTQHPGDRFLQGSFDGSEPYEEVRAFHGKKDWKQLEPEFLDSHHSALHFFSEGALRFYLPAFLIADLNDELRTADPLFTLVHGLAEEEVNITINQRVFVRRTGRSALINPRRYGAITYAEYAQMRLSVFTREESQAIVAYLRYKRYAVPVEYTREQIDAALESFWLPRAKQAPTAADLRQHLREEQEFMAAVQDQTGNPD